MSDELEESSYSYETELQEKIVALMLIDRNFLGSVAVEAIKPHYFTDYLFRDISRWTLNYYQHYDDTPTISVLYNEIRKANEEARINDLEVERYRESVKHLFSYEISDIDYIKDEVVNFAKSQAMRQAIFRSIEILKRGADNSSEEVLKVVEKAATVGEGMDLGLGFKDLCDIHKLAIESYDPEKTVKFGLPQLDSWLLGGMSPGSLHLLCGRPGVGKSTILCSIGCSALFSRKNVFYATFELKDVDIVMKFASRISGMTPQEILSGDNTDMYQKKMDKLSQLKVNLRVKFWANKSASANTIKAHLTKLHAVEGFKPDLIIVDYPGLMLTNGRGSGDMYEDLGTIGYELIALGDEFGCPVLGACQPQRQAWFFPVIELEHLAESARLAHLAFSVITICMTRQEELEGRMRLFGAKVRRGITGRQSFCRIDHARSILRETDEEWEYV